MSTEKSWLSTLTATSPRAAAWAASVFWGFVLIAGYFLITEHRAHVIQFLPFLLVLACPLMHLFHRHGAEKKHSGGCH